MGEKKAAVKPGAKKAAVKSEANPEAKTAAKKDALIQFKIGPDGELAIVIHKLLWEELRKGSTPAKTDGDFVHIALSSLVEKKLFALEDIGGTDQWPCQPVFQFFLDRKS